MSVRVVSYNLLVPLLAEEPGFYFQCQPQYLKKSYRWDLIQSQLKQEITQHRNTIVCLQELSRTMMPEIESFFRGQRYILHHKLYGQQHNDYMGVGIAIPLSMKTTSVLFIKVGSEIKSVLHEKAKKQASSFDGLLNLCARKPAEPELDPWELAVQKSNVLVFLQVIVDGALLSVGTYHMPCMFKAPDVMLIHACTVKEVMFQLAKGQNFILAGDFNMKPVDKPYRVITERGYAVSSLPSPTNYTLKYQPHPDHVLRSAYQEKNGVEPAFTNFAVTTRAGYFCATIDYIFFHGNLSVDNVLALPSQPRCASYPDINHPSDHLMVAASFRFR